MTKLSEQIDQEEAQQVSDLYERLFRQREISFYEHELLLRFQGSVNQALHRADELLDETQLLLDEQQKELRAALLTRNAAEYRAKELEATGAKFRELQKLYTHLLFSLGVERASALLDMAGFPDE